MKRPKPIHSPIHTKIRKPMPAKPPKVDIPKAVYRRRPKHRGAAGSE